MRPFPPRLLHAPRHPRTRRRRAAGTAVIEVLIAMLVVALWLLGSATLQLSSLKLHKSAGNRALAVGLASELTEAIEANPVGANAGHYALAQRTTASSSSTNCATTYCTPQQLAVYNLAQWTGRLVGTLPLQDVAVEKDTTADGLVRYTIRIRWKEPLAQAPAASAVTTETLSVIVTKVVRDA